MTYKLPVIQDAYRAFDERVAGTIALAKAQGNAVPCGRGCSACCSEPAVVFHYEVPPLVEAIRAKPQWERELIKLRINEWARIVKRKGIPLDTSDEVDMVRWHTKPKPVCPLLDLATGDCSVYEARPLACRAHVSIDERSACERADPRRSVAVLVFTNEVAQVGAYIIGQSVEGEPRDVPLAMLLLPAMLRFAWELVEQPEVDYASWFEGIERRYLPQIGVK